MRYALPHLKEGRFASGGRRLLSESLLLIIDKSLAVEIHALPEGEHCEFE
jgi:hypothetical protein